MTQAQVAVGGKITAGAFNALVNSVNAMGLTQVIPTSVSGTGVAVSTGGTVSLTACTGVNLNGVFTSAFTNYRIVMEVVTSGGTGIAMLLSALGTNNTTSNYDVQTALASGSTQTDSQVLAGSQWRIEAASSSGMTHTITIDIFGPNLASACSALETAWSWPNPLTTAGGVALRGLSNRLATAFDGFGLTSTAGMTGTIAVYGYNAA